LGIEIELLPNSEGSVVDRNEAKGVASGNAKAAPDMIIAG
jgi:hypothetical protein